MQQRLKKIMILLFDINENDINDESSIDNVKGWDSLKHMEFIFAIEEEFKIKPLTADQVSEMRTYGEVKKVLASSLNDN